jgi:long-chain acyl-CoA synthetase
MVSSEGVRNVAHPSPSPEPVLIPPWISHYDPGIPATIPDSSMTLSELLTTAARQCGDRTAVIYYGNRITYLQLELAAARFAHELLRMGIQRGDRVAICLPNVPQYLIAYYGILKAGAIVVPVNPIYTAHEMRYQLADSGAKAIVILDILYPTLHQVRGETPIRHIILTNAGDYLPFPLSKLYPFKEAQEQRGKPRVPAEVIKHDPAISQMRDLIAKAASKRGGYTLLEQTSPVNIDDVAILQYTGGTTGVSKGAMLTHRNLVANAVQCATWTGTTRFKKSVTLAVTPFFHVYGLTVALNMPVYNGSTMVLLPRFIPGDVLNAIEKYKPDSFPGIPTMYLAITREIEKRGKGDISSVNVCLSGAAPLLHEVQTRFEQLSGAHVSEGYGLTEASPVTHCNPLFGDRRIGTIGLPLPSTEAKVIDPVTGKTMPLGEKGEMVVRGPQVMKGYWNRPDETEKVLQDGWLHTGDIATMNADGYFSIVDRAKDIIIAGGYNIYPREVEEVLASFPAIQECVVVGIPDLYRGETVRAYIILKDGEHATAEEIITFCKRELAPYKVPKQIIFREELPKSLIGKILRRALRDEATAEQSQRNSA